MTKDKPLSEKKVFGKSGEMEFEGLNYFWEEDVAEAVKKLKEFVMSDFPLTSMISKVVVKEEIDKIFGKELSGGNER